jgi:gamma-glutamylcyclotransferase (GGCT)/AIG2-like uncharacterized protein YtfP
MADFYFAYGSNLNLSQFQRRCPDARPIARMKLPDYRLVFRGVADVVPASGRIVQGALYRITKRCEAALDRYEGFPHLYRKETFIIEIGHGPDAKVVNVMFYVMNDHYISPPSPYYLQTIEDGYHDWKIPNASLKRAVNHAYRITANKAKRASEKVARRASRASEGAADAA